MGRHFGLAPWPGGAAARPAEHASQDVLTCVLELGNLAAVILKRRTPDCAAGTSGHVAAAAVGAAASASASASVAARARIKAIERVFMQLFLGWATWQPGQGIRVTRGATPHSQLARWYYNNGHKNGVKQLMPPASASLSASCCSHLRGDGSAAS